jgi:outer membrane immunogenic protein
MKRKLVWLVLLPALAVAAVAQESRQDVSLSATGLFPTTVYGNDVIAQGRNVLGGLASYRFMLSPRNALEGNYQYSQEIYNFNSGNGAYSVKVHARVQEFSAAYVFNLNYGNFNPFIEVGPAGFIMSPILDSSTSTLDVTKNTSIGAIYGVGLAYEISPSFDIRGEFRGLLMKEPSFNVPAISTNRYTNVINPTIGVAYHF